MEIVVRASEPRLMKYIMELNNNPKGYTALHFHFSNLSSIYKTNYHMRIALNLINEHLNHFDGTAFLLENYDIVIIAYTTKSDIIDKIIFHLRYLFVEDPIANKKGFGEDNLCSIYFLGFEMKKFIEACNSLLSDFQERVKKKKVMGIQENINITSEIMRDIENKLFTVEINKFLRKQNIAAIVGTTTKGIYQEIYISLGHFKQLLDERVSECSERIINQFLFEKLDQIVLNYIANNMEEFLKNPFSLNLVINTVISDGFMDFVKLIPDNYREAILVELQVSDIFYDMAAYNTAKKLLKNYKIKVCLDGINNLSFLQIDRHALEIDLIKLQWNSDIAKNLGKKENQELVDKVASCDPKKIILSRCDDEKAVQYGQVLGIKMFQGWHIDRLLGVK